MRKTSTKLIAFLVLLSFGLQSLGPVSLVQAQMVMNLPLPGTMVTCSNDSLPPVLNGLVLNPDNPFQFDFILDMGDMMLSNDDLQQQSDRLIKYFLAALTTPEDEMWVNLSPHEPDRIVPEDFGLTEMGRDMLAQDYILKQLSASLIYPDEEIGKNFWDRVYQKAMDRFGTTQIPFNTFNKVWIVPDQAVVFADGNLAFIIDSHLKVMLEEDYLALQQAQKLEAPSKKKLAQIKPMDGGISAEILREIIVPEIEREVNEGEHFTTLRQIFHSSILAKWYKVNLTQSILAQKYADQHKIEGVEVDDKEVKKKIYKQYLLAFRKGVYNFIKEDYDPASQQMIPRKYFSGGTSMVIPLTQTNDLALLSQMEHGPLVRVQSRFQQPKAGDETVDAASLTEEQAWRKLIKGALADGGSTEQDERFDEFNLLDRTSTSWRSDIFLTILNRSSIKIAEEPRGLIWGFGNNFYEIMDYFQGLKMKSVVGVELFADRVRLAARYLAKSGYTEDQVSLFQASIDNLTGIVEDGSVDFVLGISVMPHDRIDYEPMAQEISRVLAPGGISFIGGDIMSYLLPSIVEAFQKQDGIAMKFAEGILFIKRDKEGQDAADAAMLSFSLKDLGQRLDTDFNRKGPLAIFSLEEGYDDVLAGTDRIKEGEGIHVGTGTMLNLDLVGLRRSSQALIIDRNDNVMDFYDSIQETILSPEILDDQIPVQQRRSMFITRWLARLQSKGLIENDLSFPTAPFSQRFALFEDRMNQLLQEPHSWLSDDERFMHILNMFKEGKFIYTRADILDPHFAALINQWLSDHKALIDSFYASNIYRLFNAQDNPQAQQESFRLQLKRMLHDHSLIVEVNPGTPALLTVNPFSNTMHYVQDYSTTVVGNPDNLTKNPFYTYSSRHWRLQDEVMNLLRHTAQQTGNKIRRIGEVGLGDNIKGVAPTFHDLGRKIEIFKYEGILADDYQLVGIDRNQQVVTRARDSLEQKKQEDYVYDYLAHTTFQQGSYERLAEWAKENGPFQLITTANTMYYVRSRADRLRYRQYIANALEVGGILVEHDVNMTIWQQKQADGRLVPVKITFRSDMNFMLKKEMLEIMLHHLLSRYKDFDHLKEKGDYQQVLWALIKVMRELSDWDQENRQDMPVYSPDAFQIVHQHLLKLVKENMNERHLQKMTETVRENPYSFEQEAHHSLNFLLTSDQNLFPEEESDDFAMLARDAPASIPTEIFSRDNAMLGQAVVGTLEYAFFEIAAYVARVKAAEATALRRNIETEKGLILKEIEDRAQGTISQLIDQIDEHFAEHDVQKIKEELSESLSAIFNYAIENAFDAYYFQRVMDQQLDIPLTLQFALDFDEEDNVYFRLISNGMPKKQFELMKDKMDRIGGYGIGKVGMQIAGMDWNADFNLYDRQERLGDMDGAIFEGRILNVHLLGRIPPKDADAAQLNDKDKASIQTRWAVEQKRIESLYAENQAALDRLGDRFDRENISTVTLKPSDIFLKYFGDKYGNAQAVLDQIRGVESARTTVDSKLARLWTTRSFENAQIKYGWFDVTQDLFALLSRLEEPDVSNDIRFFAWQLGIQAFDDLYQTKTHLFDEQLLLEPDKDYNGGLFIDLASGPVVARFFKNLSASNKYIFVDNRYEIEGFLQRARETLDIRDHIEIRRADLNNLGEVFPQGESYQYIRLSDIDSYVDKIEGPFIQTLTERVAEGGKISIEYSFQRTALPERWVLPQLGPMLDADGQWERGFEQTVWGAERLEGEAFIFRKKSAADAAMLSGISEIGKRVISQADDDFESVKRNIFGQGIDFWLEQLRSRGKFNDLRRKQIIDELWQRRDFKDLVLNTYSEDLGIALVRFLVENDVPIESKSLQFFMEDLRAKVFQENRKEIKIVHLPVEDFIAFITTLALPQVQQKLNAMDFRLLSKSDKMIALLDILSEYTYIDFAEKHGAQFHSALPQQVSRLVSRREVIANSYNVDKLNAVRNFLRSDQAQRFLQSDDFLLLSRSDKFDALYRQVTDALGVSITRNSFYAILPYALAPSVTKRHLTPQKPRVSTTISPIEQAFINQGSAQPAAIKRNLFGDNIDAWLQQNKATQPSLDKIEEAISRVIDDLEQELLEVSSPAQARMIVLRHMVDNNIPMGTLEFLPFSTQFKKIASGDLKKIWGIVTMNVEDYVNIMTYLASGAFQSFINSPDFHRLPIAERLPAIAQKITDNVAFIKPVNLENLHKILLPRISATLVKTDISQVERLTLEEYQRVQQAIYHPDMQMMMTSDRFLSLDKEDQLIEIALYLGQQGIIDGDMSVHVLYSALPENLLSVDYRHEQLQLQGDQYGIYRYEMLKIKGRVQDIMNVRSLLRHPRVVQFLSTSDLFDLDPEDRLVYLYEEMRKIAQEEGFGFELNKSLTNFYYFLPYRLSEVITKDSIPMVEGTINTFNQLRKGLEDKRINDLLESEAFLEQEKQAKTDDLVRALKEFGFVSPSVRPDRVYRALPFELKELITKGTLDRAMLGAQGLAAPGEEIILTHENRLLVTEAAHRVVEQVRTRGIEIIFMSGKSASLTKMLFEEAWAAQGLDPLAMPDLVLMGREADQFYDRYWLLDIESGDFDKKDMEQLLTYELRKHTRLSLRRAKQKKAMYLDDHARNGFKLSRIGFLFHGVGFDGFSVGAIIASEYAARSIINDRNKNQFDYFTGISNNDIIDNFERLAKEGISEEAIPADIISREIQMIANLFRSETTMADVEPLPSEDQAVLTSEAAGRDTVGGIDLNPENMTIMNQGPGIDIPIPETPDGWKDVEIDGLTPFIFNIVPLPNIEMLFGERQSTEPDQISYLKKEK